MHIFVSHSDEIDPAEAAEDLVQQVRSAINGRKIIGGLLFASVSYDHEIILKRIEAELPGICLVGCSSDGEISTIKSFSEDSVVLALFSSDRVTVSTGIGTSLSKNGRIATQTAINDALADLHGDANLCFIFFESLSGVDSSSVVDVATETLGSKVRILGGLSADNWKFEKTYQFHDFVSHQDSVVVMLFSGDINTSSGIASGWMPIGEKKVVTKSEGNVVHKIGDLDATTFYQNYIGDFSIPSGEYPLAIITANNGHYLRSPLGFSKKDGSVTFAGNVPEGVFVQITDTSRDALVDAAKFVASESLEKADKKPKAAFIISCAARKEMLGTKTIQESMMISDVLGGDIPVFGFYAFGEIGPDFASNNTFFFNETIICTLIW